MNNKKQPLHIYHSKAISETDDQKQILQQKMPLLFYSFRKLQGIWAVSQTVDKHQYVDTYHKSYITISYAAQQKREISKPYGPLLLGDRVPDTTVTTLHGMETVRKEGEAGTSRSTASKRQLLLKRKRLSLGVAPIYYSLLLFLFFKIISSNF